MSATATSQTLCTQGVCPCCRKNAPIAFNTDFPEEPPHTEEPENYTMQKHKAGADLCAGQHRSPLEIIV